MLRMCDMRQKEVINVRDGFRFGFVCDVGLDPKKGVVVCIIVPCEARMLGMFGVESEYHIPWCDITKIGDDVVLVDVDASKIVVNCD